ncbi:MAG: Smr/MutS family protein [marine benthic group bacterium]|nr:Smr/MutS family protein [Gemmatimonadota bacterium]
MREPVAAGDRSSRGVSLDRIDWNEVLDRIAQAATSELGAEHVRGLLPATDPAEAERRLDLADQMVGLLLKLDWSPPVIPDCRPAVRRLEIEGSVLDIGELAELATLLGGSRSARSHLRRFPEELPALTELGGRLIKEPSLQSEITSAIDEGGSIRDSASPDLRKIRRGIRSARSRLVTKLESFARGLPDRIRLNDASITIRAGRYCIPIRREGRSEVGGIVHDESATHQTVFVEPPLAIEPMNRLAELEREEGREIARILAALTETARPHAGELQTTLDALAEADSLFARARWTLNHGGTRPEFLADGAPESSDLVLRLVAAHHPLLVGSAEPSVPFDLDLYAGETVLLISGPNAGGKTVLLKTIGLTCLLAQAGVLPPVGPGTRLPVFERLFAVIGDEQSISASLSTFSAQVSGVRLTLEGSDANSLVLLDEIGSSTDPSEGAALAAAVLSRLAGQAGLTVATTHLGALKALATEDDRIVNASLQFDTRLLRPTFRLVRDRPGRSYAIEIATRLGLPDDVIQEAQSRIGAGDRGIEALLAELEKREAELSSLTAAAQVEERRIREREARLSASEARAVEAERRLEREGRARAEEYLREARRSVAEEIRRLRAEFRRAASDAHPAIAEKEAARVRARVESLFKEAKRPAGASEGSAPAGPANQPAGVIRPGDHVRSKSLGVEGVVAEVRGERVILDADGVRLDVPLTDTERTTRSGGPRRQVRAQTANQPSSTASDLPDMLARPEVDLRGLRVDEIEQALLPAVDAAHVVDLPSLRIIHGKGTFALREEVGRLLAGDRRIDRLRPGGFEEGGSGVTVVEFQRGGD